MFILGHAPSFFVLLCLASFFWVFKYSPEFYPFPGTRPDPSPVLTRILFLYLSGFYPFLGTCLDPSPVLTRILFLYLPGFYPFLGTCLDPSLVLTRILPLSWYSSGPFSGTHPDSTPFSVLARTLLRYSPRFYPFPGTRSDPSPVLA